MTQEKKDNDKKFIRMLESAEEIPLKMLKNWHRGDEVRIEMVAKALAAGDVNFCMKTDLSDHGRKNAKNNLWNLTTGKIEVPDHVPLTGYQRVVKIKEYMSMGLYFPYHFHIDAASLRKWIDNTFQPVPDSPKGFMSERLRIAVEISEKLYPNGYVTRGRSAYSAAKGDIDKELDKENIKSDLKEWMQKIINPEPWS